MKGVVTINKLSLAVNNKNIDIIIEEFKIIMGNNYNIKYDILKSIRNYFDKGTKTEYELEKNQKNSVLWNEKALDIKRFNYLEINNNFDLNNDMKLGTKSLLARYYESLLTDIEYNDTLYTINNLIDSLSEEIFGYNEIYSNLKLFSKIIQLNPKTIIKLLDLNLLKEDYVANQYALTYEENIIFQIEIAKRIAEKSTNTNYIVFVDIPIITSDIIENIKHNHANLHIIVLTYFTKDISEIKTENIAFTFNNYIDLLDEEALYEIALNINKNLSIEQIRNEILKFGIQKAVIQNVEKII